MSNIARAMMLIAWYVNTQPEIQMMLNVSLGYAFFWFLFNLWAPTFEKIMQKTMRNALQKAPRVFFTVVFAFLLFTLSYCLFHIWRAYKLSTLLCYDGLSISFPVVLMLIGSIFNILWFFPPVITSGYSLGKKMVASKCSF
jgi:hypothetical protein